MYGIVGIYQPKIEVNAIKSILYPMITSLNHRGPDSWGTYISKDIALGHARLAILDLKNGSQPMESPRYVIAYNGEVCNYIEIKEELLQKGYLFKTTSDTEVVLQAMSQFINSDHTTLTINYNSIHDNFINSLIHSERPVFRTAPILLYLLSKTVSENQIKVFLTGEAADEILWGYDSFKELILLDAWKNQAPTENINSMLKQLYPHLHHYKDPKYLGLMKMFYEGF